MGGELRVGWGQAKRGRQGSVVHLSLVLRSGSYLNREAFWQDTLAAARRSGGGRWSDHDVGRPLKRL